LPADLSITASPADVKKVTYKMKWKQIISFLFLLALIFATPLRVQAATFKGNPSSNCAISLVGEIVEGDFEKFKLLAKKKKLSNGNEGSDVENTYDEALCLDSGGGNYFEGRLIANFVHKYAIVTRILKNSECYSACALIFMAGRIHGDEIDGPAKFLSVNGKLGFHAPYFTFDDNTSFSGKEVKSFTSLQNLLVADLIDFGSFASEFNFRPNIPASLLVEIYRKKPNELSLVDTVDKAARWGVDLEGVEIKLSLSKQQEIQLCLNFQSWTRDESAVEAVKTDAMAFYMSQPDNQVLYSGKPFHVIDTGGMETRNCQIEIQNKASLNQQICLKDDFSGRHLGDCSNGIGYWVPSYFALPADTQISKLTDF
jgi:hypothetical protein